MSVEKKWVDLFHGAVSDAFDFASMRIVHESQHELSINDGVVQPPKSFNDVGAMITVVHEGGIGYAATQRLDRAGIEQAIDTAQQWAQLGAKKSDGTHRAAIANFSEMPWPTPEQHHATEVKRTWADLSAADKRLLLTDLDRVLAQGPSVASRSAALWWIMHHSTYITSQNSLATEERTFMAPDLRVTTYKDGLAQTRSFGLFGESRQGGLEVLDHIGLKDRAQILNQEAHQLLDAENCPSGELDLLLMPDQMMLQIHESIGHPIELDRILGDERNYAGTSFVTLDMLGSYQYGSELLNVVFDPTEHNQLASYQVDDEGSSAEKVLVIENGILKRSLGGFVSQQRAGVNGTANARACSWNRPPMDRMANLNVVPGDHSLEQLIGSIEDGVMMQTNCSWSIDDSRNKFQFGCEIGWRIQNGERTHMVRNPNYRGISATFWRNLSAVGDRSTYEVLGTPFCGKGEPNQVIRVGHASPACRFSKVSIFGGSN